jgi:hypothetical protein
LETYLDESVKLRAMDKDQLNDLITQICKLDVKRDDDDADRLAKARVVPSANVVTLPASSTR